MSVRAQLVWVTVAELEPLEFWPPWWAPTHPYGQRKIPRHALLRLNQKTTTVQDGTGGSLRQKGQSHGGLCWSMSEAGVLCRVCLRWALQNELLSCFIPSQLHCLCDSCLLVSKPCISDGFQVTRWPSKALSLIEPIHSFSVVSTGCRFAPAYVLKCVCWFSFGRLFFT